MTTVTAALAEGMFVAILHSDYVANGAPDVAAARHAAFVELMEYGIAGCAAEVAAEFGDHPVESALRMSEARAMVGVR